MAQLMPLPLTDSCFSKIQIGITFLVAAHLGRRGKMAVKWGCVCVHACVCARDKWCVLMAEPACIVPAQLQKVDSCFCRAGEPTVFVDRRVPDRRRQFIAVQLRWTRRQLSTAAAAAVGTRQRRVCSAVAGTRVAVPDGRRFAERQAFLHAVDVAFAGPPRTRDVAPAPGLPARVRRLRRHAAARVGESQPQ